jgi:hypothetical protein
MFIAFEQVLTIAPIAYWNEHQTSFTRVYQRYLKDLLAASIYNQVLEAFSSLALYYYQNQLSG